MKEKNFQEISKRIKELLNSSEMDLIEICDVISDVEKQEVINILNYLITIKLQSLGTNINGKNKFVA